MSVTDLWQVQIGQESARGTSVDPTAKLMGVTDFTITPIEESAIHEELRGSLQPGFNATQRRRAAEWSLSMDASYEHILYVLQMLFSEDATPVGTADPYTWSYAAPLSAAPTPQPMTIVKGDGYSGSLGYGVWGALCSSLSISGATGEPWTLSASGIGTQADEDALADLSDTSVNFIMGDHTALYIDDDDGTMGATALASTAYSFELSINANRANKHYLGALGPGGWRDVKWETTLSLMLELTDGTGATATEALLASMIDSAPLGKQIRIKATDSTRVAQLDFAGVTLAPPNLFDEQDGVVALSSEWTGMYNSTLGNHLEIEVQNASSSLT